MANDDGRLLTDLNSQDGPFGKGGFEEKLYVAKLSQDIVRQMWTD